MKIRTWVESALDWLQRGQAVFALLVALGGGTGIRALLTTFNLIPRAGILPISSLAAALLLVVSFRAFTTLIGRNLLEKQIGGGQLVGTAVAPTTTDLDLRRFVNTAYRSTLADECEAHVRAALDKVPSEERETLFVRFIAVGIISYIYDEVWWLIFQSQIHALEALNQRVMRTEDVKTMFYDPAAAASPEQYTNYGFDKWLDFLTSHTLILDLPADAAGITKRGKDFLGYLVHNGRAATDKRL